MKIQKLNQFNEGMGGSSSLHKRNFKMPNNTENCYDITIDLNILPYNLMYGCSIDNLDSNTLYHARNKEFDDIDKQYNNILRTCTNKLELNNIEILTSDIVYDVYNNFIASGKIIMGIELSVDDVYTALEIISTTINKTILPNYYYFTAYYTISGPNTDDDSVYFSMTKMDNFKKL